MIESPENNRAEINKIISIIKSANVSLFDVASAESPLGSAAIATLKFDDEANIWLYKGAKFLQNTQKSHELRLQLLYSNGPASDFVKMFGIAEMLIKSSRKQQVWNDWNERWSIHNSEPQITLLYFKRENAYFKSAGSLEILDLLKTIFESDKKSVPASCII